MALEYAEAMTRVDDDLEEQLKNNWGDDEIVELTAFIASQNMSSEFHRALDVPPQGFSQRPQNTLPLEEEATIP